MKARNREINIFNMSLLDILCGALGAFCFMMLVLFPYYTPGARSKAPDQPPGVDPKTLEDARRRIQELEQYSEKLKRYSEQLERENEDLRQKAKRTSGRMDQLEMRNPFVALLSGIPASGDKIQIWVEDDRTSVNRETGKTSGGPYKVNPAELEGPRWNGDISYGVLGQAGYYMVRDTPPGDYRIMLKIVEHDTTKGPYRSYVAVNGPGIGDEGPFFEVNQRRALIPVAIVHYDQDYNATLRWVLPRELWTEKDWKPREQK